MGMPLRPPVMDKEERYGHLRRWVVTPTPPRLEELTAFAMTITPEEMVDSLQYLFGYSHGYKTGVGEAFLDPVPQVGRLLRPHEVLQDCAVRILIQARHEDCRKCREHIEEAANLVTMVADIAEFAHTVEWHPVNLRLLRRMYLLADALRAPWVFAKLIKLRGVRWLLRI